MRFITDKSLSFRRLLIKNTVVHLPLTFPHLKRPFEQSSKQEVDSVYLVPHYTIIHIFFPILHATWIDDVVQSIVPDYLMLEENSVAIASLFLMFSSSTYLERLFCFGRILISESNSTNSSMSSSSVRKFWNKSCKRLGRFRWRMNSTITRTCMLLILNLSFHFYFDNVLRKEFSTNRTLTLTIFSYTIFWIRTIINNNKRILLFINKIRITARIWGSN